MQRMLLFLLSSVGTILLLHTATAQNDPQWMAGYNNGGGGFFIRNADHTVDIRVLGYAQAVSTIYDKSALPVKATSYDFNIRRARLDFMATFMKDYTLFIELDGAPTTRTAMVEAWINARFVDNVFQLRAGKFIVPFSTENLRSSRAYDQVERYLALNSMFVLPGLDTQYGFMLWGSAGSSVPVTYWIGIFNGNGTANSNIRENNVGKELVAKIRVQPDPHLELSAAIDNSSEAAQRLKLTDYTFTDFFAVDVAGHRFGYNADFFYENGPFSLRGEGLVMSFTDSRYQLRGGFIQPAFFVTGNAQQGVQPLVRLDYADIHSTGGKGTVALRTVMPGVQWFINPNVRLQVNYGFVTTSGIGNQTAYAKDDNARHIVLTELQVKF